jgi:bisanhydrobacterioruberin hydratase
MLKFPKHHLAILLLVIIHAVGFLGTIFYSDEVMRLTPINLLVSMGLVLWFHEPINRNFITYLIVVYMCGFLLELAGVITGKIFGSYFYGNGLGIKWLDVPLIIGMNWVMLSYCSVCLIARLFKNTLINQALVLIPLVSAIAMVGVDVLMEQLCQRFDFWYWKGNAIPLQNYTAWFLFSFSFNFLMMRLDVSAKNKIAPALFILQGAFFAGLNLWLK